MKQCISCLMHKPLDCFTMERGKPRGSCKACRNAYRKTISHTIYANAKAKREANPELFAEYKRRHRAKPEVQERERAYNKAHKEKNKERGAETRRLYNIANAEKIKAYASKKYFDNREKALAVNREWRERNKEYRTAYTEAYMQSHRGERAALQRLRHARKLMATPSWAQKEAIKEIYREAAKIDGAHVDHIVPLKSEFVCGLHVLANLQILPAGENIKKSNRIWPDMWEAT